jgi:hypothetical protein
MQIRVGILKYKYQVLFVCYMHMTKATNKYNSCNAVDKHCLKIIAKILFS